MPASPTLTARDARILAGHSAGRSLLDLAAAENVNPAVVRRVLREHGIERAVSLHLTGVSASASNCKSRKRAMRLRTCRPAPPR